MDVHRSGAWTLGQRWIQLQQRRCRRNTNADCIAVSIEPSSVDLATMGAQMAVRLEPPWIRHSAPTGCTKQEWNATASLPPLLLLQDAWNPFQMKRGKDSGVVWMGPAQSCLAGKLPARSRILDPNKPSVPGKIAWNLSKTEREALRARQKSPR